MKIHRGIILGDCAGSLLTHFPFFSVQITQLHAMPDHVHAFCAQHAVYVFYQTVFDRVIQNRPVCLHTTVWIVVNREVCMDMCLVLNGYRNGYLPNRGSGELVQVFSTCPFLRLGA